MDRGLATVGFGLAAACAAALWFQRPRYTPYVRRHVRCCTNPDTCLCELNATFSRDLRRAVAMMPARYIDEDRGRRP